MDGNGEKRGRVPQRLVDATPSYLPPYLAYHLDNQHKAVDCGKVKATNYLVAFTYLQDYFLKIP